MEFVNTTPDLSLVMPLLTLNRAYQEVIQEKLQKLRQLLEENQHKQNQILEKLSMAQQKPVNDKTPKDQADADIDVNKIKESYFRSVFKEIPPDNVDAIAKKNLILYEYTPTLKPDWNLKNRTKLKGAIVEDARKILKAPLLSRLQIFNEKLKKSDPDSDAYASLKTKYKQIDNELKMFDCLSEDEVVQRVDINRIDWFKISNKNFDNQWSANECRLVWQNVCHPAINQTKWQQEENNKLIELARKYREKSWAKIAIELNTNRSVYLCMKRYHEKTVTKYCKRDWTQEESDELLFLAEKYRIGLYIPYNFCKWTDDEDKLLLDALSFHKSQYNWPEISEFVGTRSALQCRDRYENRYVKPSKYVNWTLDEDKILLDMYDEHGPQWVKIAGRLPSRTDHSCLTRHQKLTKWRQQWEWFKNQPEEIRDFIEFVCKSDEKSAEKITTAKGEVVPRVPPYMSSPSFINNIVAKVYENKEAVFEFTKQKRNGILNLSLIEKIGIRTQTTVGLMRQYRKVGLDHSQPVKRNQAKRTKRIRPSKATGKTSQTRIRKTKPQKRSKPDDESRNASINKSQDTINDKQNHPIREQQQTKDDENHEAPKLRQLLPRPIDCNIRPQVDERNRSLLSDLKVTNENKQRKIYKKKVRTAKRRIRQAKIRELLKETDYTTNATNSVDASESTMFEIVDANKRPCLPFVFGEQAASLVVKFDSIPNDTKIPCLAEQFHKFKYLYSLKKDANNFKYFEKYVLLNCNEKIVAIKTDGGVTEDYFTQEKRDQIEAALDNVFKVNITPKPSKIPKKTKKHETVNPDKNLLGES